MNCNYIELLSVYYEKSYGFSFFASFYLILFLRTILPAYSISPLSILSRDFSFIKLADITFDVIWNGIMYMYGYVETSK